VQKIGASECNPAYGWGPLHQPREAMNFMCVGGEGFGVTVSTSVLGMDYIDPTDRPAKEDIIQPMLFASRQQEGAREWWEQRGTHRYRFSIYSHAPGYVNGYRLAMQSNNPLLAIAPGSKAPDARLPESGSFCSVSPSNLVISAIKKAEDDNGVVVRLYDVEGVDCKEVRLSFRMNPTAAWKTDLIEGNPTKAECRGTTVTFPVGHHAIEAVKVKFEEETKR
jgi:alpha-mannosidase